VQKAIAAQEAGVARLSLSQLGRQRSLVDNWVVKRTIEMINEMQADGVISHYAIGGAVAATFYLEPAATLDVDVFVLLSNPSGALISLAPIYEYLLSRGGVEDREHIVLGDWPVQFLVPSNELELEAITASVPVDLEGVRTWVMLPEHLVAIALSTGRAKDHLRVLQFINEKAVDQVTLEAILEKHGLGSKWKKFQHKFLEGNP
jgi:hypothetical protein